MCWTSSEGLQKQHILAIRIFAHSASKNYTIDDPDYPPGIVIDCDRTAPNALKYCSFLGVAEEAQIRFYKKKEGFYTSGRFQEIFDEWKFFTLAKARDRQHIEDIMSYLKNETLGSIASEKSTGHRASAHVLSEKLQEKTRKAEAEAENSRRLHLEASTTITTVRTRMLTQVGYI
ncbi:hypothetical protein BT63DRAFT_428233 [Microthyrium microscopicum]|uniref:Uncharacterized protein n=1 Tax=Microthyrium microscopicum TaxID=703497 RepID=A0A6A6U2F4_9PEZI|nr:hypothetical protein BT63DRAFT_428233 [Microthyrium microscopicum]